MRATPTKQANSAPIAPRQTVGVPNATLGSKKDGNESRYSDKKHCCHDARRADRLVLATDDSREDREADEVGPVNTSNDHRGGITPSGHSTSLRSSSGGARRRRRGGHRPDRRGHSAGCRINGRRTCAPVSSERALGAWTVSSYGAPRCVLAHDQPLIPSCVWGNPCFTNRGAAAKTKLPEDVPPTPQSPCTRWSTRPSSIAHQFAAAHAGAILRQRTIAAAKSSCAYFGTSGARDYHSGTARSVVPTSALQVLQQKFQ